MDTLTGAGLARTPVLVLDGNENQAVACVRALGRRGGPVWVGADTRWSKAGWSRHADGTFTYPGPQKDAPAFVAAIVHEVQKRPGAVVLPMTERTTLPLSAHRDDVAAAGGRLVLPAHETVLHAFDKARTTALAESLGLRVPFTRTVESGGEALNLAASIRYPVVLKPRSSEEVGFAGRTRSTGPPVYAGNPHDLMVGYRALSQRCRSVLVQEFIVGTGAGYFALFEHGELRAEFAHRRLRDVRPTGSGSSLRESARPDPAVREGSLRLLRALQWHGVAMVEYRVRPDGTPVFLEVNGRFWNSLALAVYAGVDFPGRLVGLATGEDLGPAPEYAAAVRCRWLSGDLRHLLLVLRGAPAGYPGRFPGRLRTLLEFLRPVAGTYHDNFEWDDPLPELGDWLDALRRLFTHPHLESREPRKERHAERRHSHT
jgi:predicted ATP-grasp superfamily ATP-dependent carboligase